MTGTIKELVEGRIAAEVANAEGAFTGLGTLHPDSEQPEQDFRELAELGLRGVKLHPDFQQFEADSDRAMRIYELCAEAGLPVLVHTGDHRFDYSNPNRIAHVLRAFPNLKLIAAHLGGWSIWDEAVSLLPDYPNLMDEREILLSFWCRYICGVMKSKPWKGEVDEDMKERKQLSFWQKTLQFLKIKEYDEEEEFQEIVFDTSECPTSLDDFKDEQVNWEVIDKYLDGDRNNIFVERFIKSKLDNLVQRIEQEKQRNLHLFIEMRNYLWT